MEQLLICMSLSLIAGLLASRAAKAVRLPAVTSYLVAGLLLGPFFLGRLGLSGWGFGFGGWTTGFCILPESAGAGFRTVSDAPGFSAQSLQKSSPSGISRPHLIQVFIKSLAFRDSEKSPGRSDRSGLPPCRRRYPTSR